MKNLLLLLLLIAQEKSTCIEEHLIKKFKINTSFYIDINTSYNDGEESISIPFDNNTFELVSSEKGQINFFFNDEKVKCIDTIPLRIFEFQGFQSTLFKETYLILGLQIRASGLGSNIVGYFVFDLKTRRLNYIEGYYLSRYFVNDYNDDLAIDFIKLNLQKTTDNSYEVSPFLYTLKTDHFVYVQNDEIESYKIKIDEKGCR